MDELKNNVGKSIKVTLARVSEMKSSAISIKNVWQEIKDNVTQRSDECIECEISEKYMQQKLNLIVVDLDNITWGLEIGCFAEKKEPIGLDELVVEFYQKKEVVGKRKKEAARNMTYARLGNRVDEFKDREAVKLLLSQGSLIDAFGTDLEYEKSVSTRVNEFLMEYLKAVDDETLNADVCANPV